MSEARCLSLSICALSLSKCALSLSKCALSLSKGDDVPHYAGSARIRARRSCPAIRAPDRQLGRTW